jgi:mannose-6-phosphate isomerase-like protein (cupin superfamily)
LRRHRLEEMVGGWFVGDFEPSAFRTGDAEVCLKEHRAGERWPAHMHARATEVNLLVSGRMRVNAEEVAAREIFLIEPGEIAAPEFITDCMVVVVKVPSVPGDKYLRP